MARYVLTKAFWSNQQRVRAGRILAQSQGEAQPGDFVWTGTLPDGAVPVGAVPPGVKPKEPFRPRMMMPQIDWTEGMRMPPDAAQKMAAVVPDVKGKMTAEQVQSAWARSRISGRFGPAKWEEQKKPKVETAKVEKMKDTRSPQTRIFDAMVDAMVGGPNDTSKLR